MREEAVVFGSTGGLVGVITDPPEKAGRAPGIVLLNSGIVHRVGPNRTYVQMARMLASLGFTVLRFDFSGIGDSSPRQDTLPFAAAAIEETREAMDLLAARRGVQQFVIAGVCSGALISLRVAEKDPRVIAALPINLAGHRARNGLDYGRTLLRHYRRIAFSSSYGTKSLRNVMAGKINFSTLSATFSSLAKRAIARPENGAGGQLNPFVALVAGLIARGVNVTLIHSEGDEGLDYTQLVLGKRLPQWEADGKLRLRVIPGANHTFTLLDNQQDLLNLLRNWAHELHNTSTPQTRVPG